MEWVILNEITSPNLAKEINRNCPNYIRLVLQGKQDSIDLEKIKGVKGDCHAILCKLINEKVEDNYIIEKNRQFGLELSDWEALCELYPTIERVQEALDKEPYFVFISLCGMSFNKADKILKKVRPDLIESDQRMAFRNRYASGGKVSNKTKDTLKVRTSKKEDNKKQEPKEMVEEVFKAKVEEALKELVEETLKEIAKEATTEMVEKVIEEVAEETPKEVAKEKPEEIVKETPKNIPKVEACKEMNKEKPIPSKANNAKKTSAYTGYKETVFTVGCCIALTVLVLAAPVTMLIVSINIDRLCFILVASWMFAMTVLFMLEFICFRKKLNSRESLMCFMALLMYVGSIIVWYVVYPIMWEFASAGRIAIYMLLSVIPQVILGRLFADVFTKKKRLKNQEKKQK